MRQLRPQQRHEKASSEKGQKRVELILNAARDILVEEGYPSLSMRKIATRADITVGNLQYYFSSKIDLLNDLVDAIIKGYVGWWDEIMADDTLTPEDQFANIIRFIIKDLTTKETTRFFPELWALANHEQFAEDAMEYVYNLEREMLIEMIGRLNPTLSTEDKNILAVYISSAMEGHTVFIGYGKKWNKYADATANLAIKGYISLIKSVTSDEIHAISAK